MRNRRGHRIVGWSGDEPVDRLDAGRHPPQAPRLDALAAAVATDQAEAHMAHDAGAVVADREPGRGPRLRRIGDLDGIDRGSRHAPPTLARATRAMSET